MVIMCLHCHIIGTISAAGGDSECTRDGRSVARYVCSRSAVVSAHDKGNGGGGAVGGAKRAEYPLQDELPKTFQNQPTNNRKKKKKRRNGRQKKLNKRRRRRWKKS